MQTTEIISSI